MRFRCVGPGAATWTKTYSGPQAQTVTSFDGTGGGQLGVAGNFAGAFEEGENVLLQAALVGDQFVIAVSPKDGGWLWGRRFNFQGNKNQKNGLGGLAGDPQASAFVTCGTTTRAATDFAAGLPWHGGQDIVVARLDGASGATMWAKQFGGVGDEGCAGVAVDSQSNTYIAGTYGWGSSIQFGAPNGGATSLLPEVGGVKDSWMFLTKLNSAGEAIWATSFGSEGQVVAATTLLPVQGDILVAGTIAGDTSKVGSSAFLARYDGTTGGRRWLQPLGAGGGITMRILAEADQKRVLFSGNYVAPCTLGRDALPAPSGGRVDSFVGQLDAVTGTVLVAKGFGDSDAQNRAAGAVSLVDAVGEDKDASLLLTSFIGSIKLGQPLGVLAAGTNNTAALALVKLAP